MVSFNVKLLLISILFVSSLCLGGFKRDRLELDSNSLQSQAREFATRLIKSEIKPSTSDVSINTIFVYKQIVNGINYKIFTLVRDGGYGELYETTIYTGPFSKEKRTFKDFELLSNEKVVLRDTDLNLKAQEHIINLITEKIGGQPNLINYLNVYMTSQSNDVFYIVQFGLRKSESRPSIAIFIDKNGSFKIDNLSLEYYEY